MYLTAGQFKGRKIEVPKTARPTLSVVRESIFNILNYLKFEDNPPMFLEMFAGSGIMGLEAISRGYKVQALEINYDAIKTIQRNYKSLGISANVIKTDCLKYKTNEKYDIIYIDPPWNFDYAPIIQKAYELIKDKGIIIIEFDKTKNININRLISQSECPLTTFKSKKYGRVMIVFLKKM